MSISYWTMSSQLIIDEAKKQKIKYNILDKDLNLFYLILNDKKILFKNIDCGLNSSLGMKLSDNKKATYKLLEKYDFISKSNYFDLNTNEHISIDNLDLKKPLVVKPIDGSHGNGVTTKIINQTELNNGIQEAKKFSNNIIIQEFQEGIETRIFVVDGKVIGGINREAPVIKGNGTSSIERLIKKENENPNRGDTPYTKAQCKIIIDTELINYIKAQGFNIDYVPQKGEVIILRGVSNMGTGGTSMDVTDVLSKDIKKMAINSCKALGLKIGGVDIISNDYTKNLSENNNAIILEVNSTPSINLHHSPVTGKSRNIAKEIIQLAKEM